jgi:hypothetical protein
MIMYLAVCSAAVSGAACRFCCWYGVQHTDAYTMSPGSKLASTVAFAAGSDDLKVRVQLTGARPATGTLTAAAATAAVVETKAQDHMLQQQQQQQQQHVPQQIQQEVQEAPALQHAQHHTSQPGRLHQIPKRMLVATGATDGCINMDEFSLLMPQASSRHSIKSSSCACMRPDPKGQVLLLSRCYTFSG